VHPYFQEKTEIEAKISFRLEAKKRHDFTCFASKVKQQKSEAKMNGE
jgi:hypothetical protein